MKALFLTLLVTSIASAEYRVYQYYVKSKYNFIQDNPAYLVTSSLDPVSYVAYHGGEEAIETSLVRTWMCPGDTSGRKEFCDSPYQQTLAEMK